MRRWWRVSGLRWPRRVWSLTAGRWELLSLAEQLADRIGELEAAISADGLTSTSKGGLVRLHTGVVEARQSRVALARVLSDIQTRDD